MKKSLLTQLITLDSLSGLNNTEEELVSKFLAKIQKNVPLNGRDIACINAMTKRHLTGVKR